MKSGVRRLHAVLGHLKNQSDIEWKPEEGSVLLPEMTSSKASSPLEQERLSATFKSRELTYFLEGGQKNTEIRENFMTLIERDPIFKLRLQIHDMSRMEQREVAMKMFARILPVLNSQTDETNRRILSTLIALFDPGLSTRLAVQFTLFLGAMRSQATEELYEEYAKMGMVEMKRIIGCFAMTELGHGSNVAGLETTATFDEATDEFIIHTPTVTATKWWIGGAAMTATYAVVYAQLIVKGKNYGVKTFLVQLRDTETFNAKTGVSIGDCGHKMGRNGLDNGWIQFSSVRIPRKQMLMKHTSVSRTGEVTLPVIEQISYAPLVHGRVAILASCSESAKKALTIAIRFGAIRRQFKMGKEELERPILDYTTHQYRLLPHLALSYAMHFCSKEMGTSTRALMKKMSSLKSSDPVALRDQILETLKEMHSTSSGLKAFCTWQTLKAIEECRQSLGGQGYSSYSALPTLYQEFCVNASWEGDNTILTLQTGRYLIGSWKDLRSEKTQVNSPGIRHLGQYLKNPKQTGQVPKFAEGDDIGNLDWLVNALGFNAAFLVSKAADHFSTVLQMTSNESLAQQESALEIMTGVRAHCQFYLVDRFADTIKKTPANLKPVLAKLCALFGCESIREGLGIYLQSGYYSVDQSELIPRRIFQLCQDLRREAVALVDAFDITDFLLESPLGAYSGDIYQNYFNFVNTARKLSV